MKEERYDAFREMEVEEEEKKVVVEKYLDKETIRKLAGSFVSREREGIEEGKRKEAIKIKTYSLYSEEERITEEIVRLSYKETGKKISSSAGLKIALKRLKEAKEEEREEIISKHLFKKRKTGTKMVRKSYSLTEREINLIDSFVMENYDQMKVSRSDVVRGALWYFILMTLEEQKKYIRKFLMIEK